MTRCLSQKTKRGLSGLLALGTLLTLVGCSDLKDNPTVPNGPAAKVHPDGWINPSAEDDFHGVALRQSGWNLANCQSCHGIDYAGGVVEQTCLTCHSDTPEGCNVCHGDRAGSIAPPEDTHGNSDTNFAGVGAHQAHLQSGTLSTALNCNDCHTMPAGFADPSHIDGDDRAELTWGERALTNDATPQYDPITNTCAGTYCHSGGKFGNDPSPIWTEVGSGQAACGTCHSLPPAPETGHPAVAEGLTCATCHGKVVDADDTIITPELHINGMVELGN